MRATLVLNPGAREGDRSPSEIIELLARHGVEATPVPVQEGRIEDALRTAISQAPEAIVVGGGDGTISTAANVLCGSAVPLGIIPLGTANDFARTIGVPQDLEQACAIIGAGHAMAIDVGLANGRHFLNVASIGLPAAVTSILTDDLKNRWGVLAYPIAALKAVTRQRPFTARLTVDGQHRRVRQVMQVAVGNGRYYGGGMSVTDAAQVTDGYLDVHVITAPNLGALLWTLRHLRSGRYARRDSALRFRTRQVRIETDRRLRVNVDGELHGHTPLAAEVLPRCLTVFAPRPAA